MRSLYKKHLAAPGELGDRLRGVGMRKLLGERGNQNANGHPSNHPDKEQFHSDCSAKREQAQDNGDPDGEVEGDA